MADDTEFTKGKKQITPCSVFAGLYIQGEFIIKTILKETLETLVF